MHISGNVFEGVFQIPFLESFFEPNFMSTLQFFIEERDADTSYGKVDFAEKWQFHFDNLPSKMQKALLREALRDLARINGYHTKDAQDEWIDSNPYLEEKALAYVRDLQQNAISTPGLRKRHWHPLEDDEVPALLGKLKDVQVSD